MMAPSPEGPIFIMYLGDIGRNFLIPPISERFYLPGNFYRGHPYQMSLQMMEYQV